MKAFIVYAHPSKKSFTYQVLSHLVDGLKAGGHAVEVSDLYEMGFQSDMSEVEYEREGFANTDLPIPVDVQIEQEKIQWADVIIFVYPVWWSDCPAKLKGWFDRVYTVGYAYGYDEQGHKLIRMNKPRLGLALCTAGHPNEFLDQIGIAESMRNVMVDDRLGNRFEKKQMIILGGTLDMDQVGEAHLQKAFNIGKDLDDLCQE